MEPVVAVPEKRTNKLRSRARKRIHDDIFRSRESVLRKVNISAPLDNLNHGRPVESYEEKEDELVTETKRMAEQKASTGKQEGYQLAEGLEGTWVNDVAVLRCDRYNYRIEAEKLIEFIRRKSNVRSDVLYKSGAERVLATNDWIDIEGLRLSYKTLLNLRDFLRSNGEFEINDNEVRYTCAWCEKPYSSPRQEVCRGSVSGLRYCSTKCRLAVSNMKSKIHKVFKLARSVVVGQNRRYFFKMMT